MNSKQTRQYAVDTLNGLDMSSLEDAVPAPPRVDVAQSAASRTTGTNPVAYLKAALAERVALPGEARHG